MKLLVKRTFMVACICLPGVCMGQSYSYRVNARRRMEQSWTGIMLSFSYGSVSGTNARFHQYLLAQSLTMTPSFQEASLSFQMQSYRFVAGLSFGAILSAPTNSFEGIHFNYFFGYSLYENNFFCSNLNGQLGIKKVSLHGFTPPTITNPQPNDYLLNDQLSIGITSQNYFRLLKQRQKTDGLISNGALLLGIEFAVDFYTDSPWQWGHISGSGKNSYFHGVDVPEIPKLDNINTTLRVSLIWKFL